MYFEQITQDDETIKNPWGSQLVVERSDPS